MSIIKSAQLNQFNRVRFSAQVFVVGMILSATFFLLLVDLFKTYRSDISILVGAKSEVALIQQKQLISNIVEFPQTLSFYDRMLRYNPDVRDVAAGLSPDRRKAKWNEMISITRADNDASVFEISIVASREADAQQLAGKTVRTLFDTVAFYYDIKKDVDLRIIDGPITKPQVLGWYWLLAISIAAGFALAILLNFIFFSGRNRLKEGSDLFKKNFFFDFKRSTEMPVEDDVDSLENLYRAEQSSAPFVFKEGNEQPLSEEDIMGIDEQDSRFQEMKKLTKKIEPGKYPNFPEMPIGHQREAGAPDNLPIVDSSYIAEYMMPEEPVAQSQSAQIEEEMVSDVTKEPTAEELKKRLNQLLEGKF